MVKNDKLFPYISSMAKSGTVLWPSLAYYGPVWTIIAMCDQ